jgi:predicted esterase
MRSTLATLTTLALLSSPTLAQPERYELGRRLKLFEATWDQQPDAAARAKALALVEKVTPQFFSFRFGEAGRTLDAARYALAAEPPSVTAKWLEALYVSPATRLVDSKTETLTVQVKAFYPVDGGPPDEAQATVWIGDGPRVEVPLGKLPAKLAVPFPPGGWQGDWLLKLEATLAGKRVMEQAVRVSTLHDLDRVFADFDTAMKWRKEQSGDQSPPLSIEAATIAARYELFRELADGFTPETDYPVAKLKAELDRMALVGAFGGRYIGPQVPGDFWLSVPIEKSRPAPIRLFVPEDMDPKKPVPVVVALHGAGGTENLFFEGYGAGRIVTECRERGWLLVATRAGLNFGGGPPVVAVLDELSRRFPIDRTKVFLVGHSMGAAQAVALAQAHPGAFAAVAALGGGGRVANGQAVEKLPLFVGVGSKDFALAGAKGLAKAATAAGAKVTEKVYPGVEHLVIVREALPDAFAIFDTLSP